MSTKNVTYDSIKATKNQSFTLSFKDTFLKKPHKGAKLTPPAFYRLIFLKYTQILNSHDVTVTAPRNLELI